MAGLGAVRTRGDRGGAGGGADVVEGNREVMRLIAWIGCVKAEVARDTSIESLHLTR
jgi:hypothetical protein